MPTLERLKRQIDSAQALQAVVGTMKTLAAVNIRQYERATRSLADYSRAVELGFQATLRDHLDELPSREKPLERLGVIAFGSDQGLCGRFNSQLADYALSTLEQYTPDGKPLELLAVGVRAAAALERVGRAPAKTLTLPGSVAALTETVSEILPLMTEWLELRDIDHILLIHNRLYRATLYAPHHQVLFPVNVSWLRELAARPWESHSLPSITLPWRNLFAALVREHFFVVLYRALAESLASENAARLAAMQTAEQNIETHLDELELAYHQA
ncbi:MAG: F0F1 ATP synthase subunit gamma, partial [Trueperaceae bacterium]